MGGRNKHNSSEGEPLRWRITEWDGRLMVVLVDMASPLMTGEALVWEGPARHMTEAYRLARDSGIPIYLNKDGFKLRASTPSRRPSRGANKEPD